MTDVCVRSGKHQYPTRRDAAKALSGIRARRHRVGALEPYQCHSCKLWHLGNPRKLKPSK